MSNINKIRLSGTTYEIQDLNATKTVELTQAEYDALSPKDPNVFYIITDAKAGDLSNYYTKSETDNAITAATSTKQDTLVSGTNIKTINNQSILGEGNIEIQGGGGSSITIDQSLDSGSTNPVANSAITETLGKYYYARKFNNSVYNSPWTQHSSNGCVGFGLEFANILNPNDSVISGVWLSKINGKKLFYAEYSEPNSDYFNLNLVETSAITTSITSESTDAQVPSAKAVYDIVGNIETLLSKI